MKKLNLLTIFIMLGIASVSYGQTGIKNSAHDFSTKGWNTTTDEICITCHTPHNALSSDAPLWNHAASTTSSFTVYSSSTLEATVGQPSGISKLCLGCHDGSVAVDNYGTTVGTHMISATNNLGGDLSGDHPISFVYDDELATGVTGDGELFMPSNVLSGLGGTIHDDLLYEGSMECSSCHDVHNGAGITNLLVMSNSGSALCLTCHDK